MQWHEVNFDGLVGPTHNYAGLSFGNLAATSNQGKVSNPLKGVLQGLGKMQHLAGLGMKQAVLPPHDRPHLSTLHGLGFTGSDEEMLAAAWSSSPELVANIMSASAMWTANAATVSPASDTADGRTHFTPANLASMYHRSIEWPTTGRILKAIFPEGNSFTHHDALAGGTHMGDEGAANHNRFCATYGARGAALFVYGQPAFAKAKDLTFPGRQTLEASQAIARQHGLDPARTVFAKQHPAAINAGAFHNDVMGVSNRTVFFYHEMAFENPAQVEADIQTTMGETPMQFIRVREAEVPLADAVQSYLFNSQLLSMPKREGMTLILPSEAENILTTKGYVAKVIASDGPINHAEYMEVRQSMRNGGGPACLRLRVVLSDDNLAELGANVMMDDGQHETLSAWAHRHYRDRLAVEDLADASLMRESFTALDELTSILQIGNVYDFQRG